jgi:hypothetical protein
VGILVGRITFRNFSIRVQLSFFLTKLIPVSNECISMSLGKYRDRISATKKPFEKSLHDQVQEMTHLSYFYISPVQFKVHILPANVKVKRCSVCIKVC